MVNGHLSLGMGHWALGIGHWLSGLRQKTTRKKPQIKLEQGIYFNAQKIAQTQIYQENN
jgi:hypothetical protein